MNKATPAVSRPFRCAKIGPKAKNALVVTPHKEAATSPKGDCFIQPLQVDPDAPALMGWRHGLNQSDRHRGECDNDRDYAERSEARQVGRREKELSGDPTHQPRHGVDAQDLSPGLVRCSAVEPALDNNEQPGKAEPGEGTSRYPRDRIDNKQVEKRRGRSDGSKSQKDSNVTDGLD